MLGEKRYKEIREYIRTSGKIGIHEFIDGDNLQDKLDLEYFLVDNTGKCTLYELNEFYKRHKMEDMIIKY